jgi:hypothetical protein
MATCKNGGERSFGSHEMKGNVGINKFRMRIIDGFVIIFQ